MTLLVVAIHGGAMPRVLLRPISVLQQLTGLHRGPQVGASPRRMCLGKHMKRALATLLVPLCAMGCVASVTHRVVDTADKDDGIRYYQSSPYLLVYSDSKGGLQGRILYLPDQTKKMAVEPHVFLGRSELTMFFRN